MWNCKPFFLGLQEFIDKLNRKKKSFASSVQKINLKLLKCQQTAVKKVNKCQNVIMGYYNMGEKNKEISSRPERTRDK